jgi:signal transduction histidine kinase
VRLPHFISTHLDAILDEFEEFARTRTDVGQSMDASALRDHGRGVLETIAADMEQPRSAEARERRSKGDVPSQAAKGPGDSPAEQHGAARAASGFTLSETTAEYRALRASVLRLWTEAGFSSGEHAFNDMIRFNEAVDEAMGESIAQYSAELESSRETFLAILGHDLRTPLGVIVTASAFLKMEGGLSGQNLMMTGRIYNSGVRMTRLVDDLLDFTSTRLGSGIPIRRIDTDMEEICREVLDEMRILHPDREFVLESEGELGGRWDAKRVAQALSNLVANAVHHGAEREPVTVRADGESDEVLVSVHNLGGAIPPESRATIFGPFSRVTAADEEGKKGRGLGLYIAKEVAVGHGGDIDVESSEAEGTTFTLRLPRGP